VKGTVEEEKLLLKHCTFINNH